MKLSAICPAAPVVTNCLEAPPWWLLKLSTIYIISLRRLAGFQLFFFPLKTEKIGGNAKDIIPLGNDES